MKNGIGSRVGSGSISQRYGPGDPDPQQNVTDPQPCFVEKFAKNLQISCQKDQIRILYNYSGSDLAKMFRIRIYVRQRLENTCGTVVRKSWRALVRAWKDSPHQIFHDGELLRVAGGVLQLRLLQIFGRLLRPAHQSISQSIHKSIKNNQSINF